MTTESVDLVGCSASYFADSARYGLSVLLLEVFYTPGIDSICRQVQRQSATSGKAGGLKKVEPLKAVRCWEPLKAVRL
jgi:hypothetical protein